MKKRTKKNTKNLSIYLVLRFLVIASGIAQAFNGNWNNVFICLITLVLFTLTSFVGKKSSIKLPTVLESIVYIFIYSSEILGEIQNFYEIFPHWDTMLHTINGFICAAIGFALVDILNKNRDCKIYMSPFYVALGAFCFSMTIGVLWEFFEYGVDTYLKQDMQKDQIIKQINSVKLNDKNENSPVLIDGIEKTEIYYNGGIITIDGGYLDIGLNDTMKDLIVNFIGALTFSIIGVIYLKDEQSDSNSSKIAKNFIPTIR